ncbi:MAG: succinylglutamate desuccinylase/aspartoacylase family protein [Deltaproteobacteria bacterium]|nr:succinylglutamate desuccinylase/aspartoacylase family protein [Deltaproteobacteria bacterium]
MKQRTRRSTNAIMLLILGVIFFSMITWNSAWCKNTYETFFSGTDYELNVYRIKGKLPGKTILIIGGIQGDEPGGFLSADLYADMKLAQGNLIVVPRANFYSIVMNRRQINEDMNRKFTEPSKRNYEAQVVAILKQLIEESDCLLNLHDGSGFYCDTWQSETRNPMRFGQSIIVDCETYNNPRTNKVLKLGDMSRHVINEINRHIEKPDFYFHLNNHRTNDQNTLHPEQRKSATYYALFKCGIPSFGIETSKAISLETRIYHHNLAINEFMRLFDIRHEVPGIFMDHPTTKYVVIKVNDKPPVVVADQETLNISRGDILKIIHVESNYERGLSADIEGYGSINDLNKAFVINHPTTVVIRKDHEQCGNIHIALNEDNNTVHTITKNPRVVYFRVRINGEERYFPNGTHVDVIKGDYIELIDAGTTPESYPGIVVNFKGFVGNRTVNTGEDRGCIIHTDRDLWKRYSLYKKGRIYQVVVERGISIIGRLFVDLKEPSFHYIVLQINGREKRCFCQNESIAINRDDTIKLIDIKTNVPHNVNIRSVLHGNDIPIPLRVGSSVTANHLNRHKSFYTITVHRGDMKIGSIPLTVLDNKMACRDKKQLQ